MFNNILTQPFKINNRKVKISHEVEDLLKKLLDRDPKSRLGSESVSKVKYHPFFKNTDWKAVIQRKVKMPEAYLA